MFSVLDTHFPSSITELIIGFLPFAEIVLNASDFPRIYYSSMKRTRFDVPDPKPAFAECVWRNRLETNVDNGVRIHACVILDCDDQERLDLIADVIAGKFFPHGHSQCAAYMMKVVSDRIQFISGEERGYFTEHWRTVVFPHMLNLVRNDTEESIALLGRGVAFAKLLCDLIRCEKRMSDESYVTPHELREWTRDQLSALLANRTLERKFWNVVFQPSIDCFRQLDRHLAPQGVHFVGQALMVPASS